MSTSPPDWPITNTEHGMLVAFGEFLRQHGLLERLRQVPVPQKRHDFSPQDKLIEFLAGITQLLRSGQVLVALSIGKTSTMDHGHWLETPR